MRIANLSADGVPPPLKAALAAKSMDIHRKLYFLGFAIYVFSFFLPAVPLFNSPIKGYECAYYVFLEMLENSSKYNVVIDYLMIIAGNLANICTVLAFILQFNLPIYKLKFLQIVVFMAASFFVFYDIFQGNGISHFFIGYWNWLFSILLMLIVSIRAGKDHKKKHEISQQWTVGGLA